MTLFFSLVLFGFGECVEPDFDRFGGGSGSADADTDTDSDSDADTDTDSDTDTADTADTGDSADTGETGEVPCDEVMWYRDADADSYGDASMIFIACDQPEGYVADATDCDDTAANVHPGSGEWCNGIDDDCDALTDEDTYTIWYTDADRDSFGDEATAVDVICNGSSGELVAARDVTGEGAYDFDCDDDNADVYPMADEYCNEIDDDCDGSIDEDEAVDVPTWYFDADSDGYGGLSSSLATCDQPSGYVADATDCNNLNATVYPGATEQCNEIDDDCDGLVPSSEVDDDLDGVSDCEGDCDDAEIDVYPGATESCNEIDDDCDGSTDESDAADASTWYYDGDGDTYGDASTSFVSCDAPAGYVADASDCDDTAATANVFGTEVCDSIDNDCDGEVDEADATDISVWSLDVDGDGYGDSTYSSFLVACDQPSGYVADFDDCDDADAAVNPAATEVYDDGIDNDCSGVIDDSTVSCYPDVDGDGYGASTGGMSEETGVCSLPDFVIDNGDCNDGNSSIHPGAYETASDSDDSDCDGLNDS